MVEANACIVGVPERKHLGCRAGPRRSRYSVWSKDAMSWSSRNAAQANVCPEHIVSSFPGGEVTSGTTSGEPLDRSKWTRALRAWF